MNKEQRYKIIAREIDFVDGIMSSHFDDYGEETHRALKEAVEIINSLSAASERNRHCPFCHTEKKYDHSTGWNFCQYCGADLRGGNK